MKIDCSFEIRGGSIGIYELKDLFDLLHKYIPEIPADPRKIGSNENSSEKDRTINELNELLERHRKDAEKSSKKIDSLDEELKEAKEYARLAEDDSKQKDAQIKKLTEENATKYNELQSNFTKEINKVKDEKEKEIAKLNKQINDLMKRISVYEPSLSGDVGDDKYFGIEGPILNETLSDDAPIIGRVDVDGNAIYQFNVEKGPHKSMCQKIAELEQFFDIVDRIEGANHISMCEWGKAKYNNGTMVPIEPKAKIKLTRE